MKRLSLIALLLSALWACASSSSSRGGEYVSEPATLCISSGAGSPVKLYYGSSYIGTTPRPNGGCIEIPDWVVLGSTSDTFCVTTVGMRGACVIMPFVDFEPGMSWSVRLGPFTNTWHYDVHSLKPTPATEAPAMEFPGPGGTEIDGAYKFHPPDFYFDWFQEVVACAKQDWAPSYSDIEFWAVPATPGYGFLREGSLNPLAGYYDSDFSPARIYLLEYDLVNEGLVKHEILHAALPDTLLDAHPIPPYDECAPRWYDPQPWHR